MTVLSYVAMYILMYAMVNALNNVIPNVNQFYMAGIMSSAMVIIELMVMRAMYMNKKLNTLLIGLSVVLMVTFFSFIQNQVGVSDKQFIKSMIPHHASAILMAKQAALHDPEIIELSKNIIASQGTEIAQMKAKLKELEK